MQHVVEGRGKRNGMVTIAARSRLDRSVELLYKPSYSILVGLRRQSSHISHVAEVGVM